MTRKSRQRDHCIGCTVRRDLLTAMRLFLPESVLKSLSPRFDARWTPWRLALTAVLMSWSTQATLSTRLEQVRVTLGQLLPGQRRVGRTYQSFAAMLRRWGPATLRLLEHHLRGAAEALLSAAPRLDRVCGWRVFAVDGTKINLPRVAALEKTFGVAGKTKSGPQALLTCLIHLASGVPWGYRAGPATGSERGHLRSMLTLLPRGALLVADAGFVGYSLLRSLAGAGGAAHTRRNQGKSGPRAGVTGGVAGGVAGGTSGGGFFLIRVGANVRLLRDMGWSIETLGHIHYLWPDARRRAGDAPLRLRLIRVHTDKGKPMCLLTNVLCSGQLSDEQAATIYRMRWEIEVFYRTLKQTLDRAKMLSRSPELAALELRWTVIGLWLLRLLILRSITTTRQDPLRMSTAGALRRLRALLREPARRLRRGDGLLPRLRRAEQDRYRRRSSKKARDWPHKKTDAPPGEPQTHPATSTQVQQAKRFEASYPAI